MSNTEKAMRVNAPLPAVLMIFLGIVGLSIGLIGIIISTTPGETAGPIGGNVVLAMISGISISVGIAIIWSTRREVETDEQ